jgi:hypothetical protein
MSLSPDCSTLFAHVPADGSTIGNRKLRELLGWNEKRYLAARRPLLDLGVLETGRGRGGSVKRAAPSKNKVEGQSSHFNIFSNLRQSFWVLRFSFPCLIKRLTD